MDEDGSAELAGRHPATEETWPQPSRGWWAVAVLTFAYIVSFVDRSLLSLLIEPVKQDLGLTDIEIALVQGLAFAIFYALMGLPCGWLADRYSRRLVVAIGALVWCCATAATGLAGSFGALFLARLFVGAGEAALSPAALSMISDLFSPTRRGPPIGVYAMSAALGSGLALIVGGALIAVVSAGESVTLPLIGEARPWQATFLVAGLGGLVLLPLLGTVREPLRRLVPGESAERQPPLLPFLARHRAFYVPHYAGIAVVSVLVYAVLSWTPSYFIRVHQVPAASVGLYYGSILLVFGGGGPILGGWIAARLFRRRGRASTVSVLAWSVIGLVPCAVIAGLSPSATQALIAWIPGSLLLTMPMATSLLALQEVTPNRLRARISALYYAFSSIVGLSIGPLSVALLTDRVFEDPATLGRAISIVAVVSGPIAALLFFAGRRHYRELAKGLASPTVQ